MKATELKQKNQEQLQEELLALRREQFNLRMQQGNKQLQKPHLLRQARRNIARVKTVIHQLNATQVK